MAEMLSLGQASALEVTCSDKNVTTVEDRVIPTRYGFVKAPDAAQDVIGRHLVQFGEWAWLETKFVSSIIADGARVLDVGAFVGTFGLGVAAVRPLGFLCCVEANPRVAPLLEQNLSGNLDCPYTAVEAVVAGPERRARTGRAAQGNLGATSYAAEAQGTGVPASMTLADLRAGMGPFDLIKLDIEGMEREALLGDAETLQAGRTTLWLECNEDRRSLDLLRLLLSWQLDVFYFAYPSFNPGNLKGSTTPIYPWAYEAGLLAAPRVVPVLTPELAACGCVLRSVRTVEDLKEMLWQTPRWGMPEWHGTASLPSFAALVGRSLSDQRRDSFLASDDGPMPQTVWTRLQRTEAALGEARQLLDTERQQRVPLDDALHAAEATAHAHLADAQSERQRREQAEQQARGAAADARASAEQLAAERDARRAAERSAQAAETLAADQAKLGRQLRSRVDQLAQDLGRADARSAEAEDAARLLERSLAQATARGLAHLSALGSERERAVERQDELIARHERAAASAARRTEAADHLALAHELAFRGAERRAQGAEAALRVMQASTMWRMLGPLRRFLHRAPRLRAALRTAAPETPAA